MIKIAMTHNHYWKSTITKDWLCGKMMFYERKHEPFLHATMGFTLINYIATGRLLKVAMIVLSEISKATSAGF